MAAASSAATSRYCDRFAPRMARRSAAVFARDAACFASSARTSSDVVTSAGALLKSFRRAPSEPSLSSARTTAACPPAAARCRGVLPTSSTSSFV